MRRVGGIFIFAIGIFLLFTSIGLNKLLVNPIVLILFSLLCWRFHYPRLTWFFIICSLLALISVDLWGLFFSLLSLYFGYRLLLNRPKREPYVVSTHQESNDIEWKPSPFNHSFIGELHLGDQQYELHDIDVSHAFSSIHIDLSRAIIPEGETTIIINGMMGQIHLYLPYDLDASISTSVLLGECEVLGKKQNGLNNQLYAATKGYQEAVRKVKISASFLVAKVHVRYL